jgi:hypothetical protein
MVTCYARHYCRGLAEVAAARGDRKAAKARYEEGVARAMIGKAPLDPIAFSEYAWLLLHDGDLRGARVYLERASDAVNGTLAAGGYVEESQRADILYRLGRVYWALGGMTRTVRWDRAQPRLNLSATGARSAPLSPASCKVGARRMGRCADGLVPERDCCSAFLCSAAALSPWRACGNLLHTNLLPVGASVRPLHARPPHRRVRLVGWLRT